MGLGYCGRSDSAEHSRLLIVEKKSVEQSTSEVSAVVNKSLMN